MKSRIRKQRGFTTLVVSLLILAVVTLITIYAANTTITEQRISATQYRSDQALVAADAGLEWGMAYFGSGGRGTLDCTATPYEPCVAPGGTAGGGTLFAAGYNGPEVRVFFCTVGTVFAIQTVDDTCPRPALDANQLGIASIGFSDDGSAVRIIRQEIQNRVFFGDGPGSAVTTPSMVDLTGTIWVINRFFNTTMWSGDSVVEWGNARSFVRNPDFPLNTSPDPNNPGFPVDYIRLTRRDVGNGFTSLASSKSWDGTNYDIVDGDVNLKRLKDNPDLLFRSLFNGASKATFERAARQAGQRYTAVQFNALTPAEKRAIAGYVFIEGANIDPNGLGLNGVLGGTQDTYPDPGNPVLVVVNGSVRFGSNSNFRGFLYVSDPGPGLSGSGELVTNGGPNLWGAVVTEGTFDGAGTPRLIYDPTAFDKSNLPSAVAPMSGTWKDW